MTPAERAEASRPHLITLRATSAFIAARLSEGQDITDASFLDVVRTFHRLVELIAHFKAGGCDPGGPAGPCVACDFGPLLAWHASVTAALDS